MARRYPGRRRSRAHKISNTVALKGSMVLLIRDAYCVKQPLLLFDDREMPVQVARAPKMSRAALALRQIVQHRALFCLVAVDFQAEHAEPRIVQTATDDFKAASSRRQRERSCLCASAAAIRFVMVCDLPVPAALQ